MNLMIPWFHSSMSVSAIEYSTMFLERIDQATVIKEMHQIEKIFDSVN